jgi:hypothetical protein
VDMKAEERDPFCAMFSRSKSSVSASSASSTENGNSDELRNDGQTCQHARFSIRVFCKAHYKSNCNSLM